MSPVDRGTMILIKAHRLRLRMTQRKLADAVGVEQGYISRLERGLQEPSGEVAKRLAEALGVSRSELYERDGFEARVYQAFENIPADRLEDALMMLEAFAKSFAQKP